MACGGGTTRAQFGAGLDPAAFQLAADVDVAAGVFVRPRLIISRSSVGLATMRKLSKPLVLIFFLICSTSRSSTSGMMTSICSAAVLANRQFLDAARD